MQPAMSSGSDHVRWLPLWLQPTGSAENLAVVRIIVCTVVLLAGRPEVLFRRATVDAPRVAPEIAGNLLLALPSSDGAVAVGTALFTFATVTALIGLKTRLSLTIAAFSAFYILGLAQTFGKVDHNHHLLWCLVILAISPCGDALALDSRGHDRSEPSRRYGLPVRMIWLVIGIAYFFAGFWKIALVGIEWAWSDNLRNIMWMEWLSRGGYEPLVDISGWGIAYRLAALFTLAFELSFVFVLFTRFRHLAVASGIMFHLGVWAMIGIWFMSLLLLYGVFFDWTATADRYRQAWRRLAGHRATRNQFVRPPIANRPSLRASASLGYALITLVALAGAGRVLEGWPVASYPDFAYRAGNRYTTYDLELVTDGSVERIGMEGLSRLKLSRLLQRTVGDRERMEVVSTRLRGSVECSAGSVVRISARTMRISDNGVAPLGKAVRIPLDVCETESS